MANLVVKDKRLPSMPTPNDHLPASERIHPRSVALLEAFFANDDERTRRAFLNQAFVDCERDPRSAINFDGAVAVFADHVVDTLLRHGCAGRGRHGLALLIETLAAGRGRQSAADFAELPRLLDACCALPTRDEELAYLERLLKEIHARARQYSALRALADLDATPGGPASGPTSTDEALDEADIALLRLEPRGDRGSERNTEEFDDILNAFGHIYRVALLGAPGAGKSTTLRRLAAELARQAVQDPAAPLPLLVTLGDWRGDEPLTVFIAAHIPEVGWALDGLARSGRLLLLLDGLNEVPTTRRKHKAGEVGVLLRQLAPRSFADTAPAAATSARVVVSCRLDDYSGELDLGLDTLTLQPLTPERVRAVLRQWTCDRGEPPERAEALFWQLAGDPDLAGVLTSWIDAGGSEAAFWSGEDSRDGEAVYCKIIGEQRVIWQCCVHDPRSLLRLSANPFMLNMLYLVWRGNGELPRNRGELFARFIDRLLAREGLLVRDADSGTWQRSVDGDRLLKGLTNLAWSMQRQRQHRNVDEAEDFGVLTVVPRSRAINHLGGAASLKVAEDATLLEGADEVRFRHQLLQEYFTAKSMQQRIVTVDLRAEQLWPVRRWWQRSGWEEAAVLLAGFHSDDCGLVIQWLKDAQPEVAAQCLLDSGAGVGDRDGLLRELHDAWLPRLTDIVQDPAPEARAAVGRALARLGLDDRRGVGLDADGLPEIDWVNIPAGEFVCQDGEHRLSETFWIARYAVTHAQFQAFLEDQDGYGNDRWWRGLDDPDRAPRQAKWLIANHPRERVSWFEAMAFCAWLSDRLGRDVRLPTEWQWERAACGSDGRGYRWGSEYQVGHANINETWKNAGPHALGRTSPVGVYPQGASPEGVRDLAGNVWEWCLNKPSNSDSIRWGCHESRVLRGGSWGSNRNRARADYRHNLLPGNRDGIIGFRVLCASPIH